MQHFTEGEPKDQTFLTISGIYILEHYRHLDLADSIPPATTHNLLDYTLFYNSMIWT